MSGLRGGAVVMPPNPRPAHAGRFTRQGRLEIHTGAESAAGAGQDRDA